MNPRKLWSFLTVLGGGPFLDFPDLGLIQGHTFWGDYDSQVFNGGDMEVALAGFAEDIGLF